MTEQLRPLSTGELLDRTFFLYRKHFALFVGISALPGLFRLTAEVLLTLTTSEQTGLGVGVFAFVTTMFLILATVVLTQAATVVAVSQLHLGRSTTIAESFAAIRSRLGEFIVLIVVMFLLVALGFLLLIVPGLWLALHFSLTMPVAVVEGKGIRDSLRRSGELTTGRKGRIILINMLLGALFVVVTLLWQLPVLVATTITGTGEQSMFGLLLVQFGSFVTQSVLGPMVTIALALVYYDERVRKEAFDLEHMMQQIDRVAPGSHSAPV